VQLCGPYPPSPRVISLRHTLNVNCANFSDMKRFVTGFVAGLLVFLAANVLAHFYHPHSSPADVSALAQYYGFPFVIWTKSGFNPHPFSGFALCADTVIALVLSAVVGLSWSSHVSFGPAWGARK
jgi:hypothetical protein